MLSDIRVEIKPRAVLDLEKVAPRSVLDDSRDLKNALGSKRLQLGRHSIIRTRAQPPPPPVKIIEKHIEKTITKDLDEERLAALIKKVMQENSQPQVEVQVPAQPDMSEIKNVLRDMMSDITDKLDNIKVTASADDIDKLPIDPAQFAEISQKSVEKISAGIETGGIKKTKKINLRNQDIHDLAGEL